MELLLVILGSEASVDDAIRAVEMLEADALQIHLNAIQELAMPEGDRDFSGALKRIEAIVKEIEVPVIVKEVGFGMNREVGCTTLFGWCAVVDVGGFGGTNFSKIENKRRKHLLRFFDGWGISTAASIAEAKDSGCVMDIISIRWDSKSLDIAKSIALGAKAVGIAGYFLKS